MDTLKNLFSDLKDRLTNPFTSSFIITWLITNYRIPVGLFFYKQNELWRDRYHSYIDLIRDNLSWWEMFWIPLLGAAFYTFVFPWLKVAIHAYRAWIDIKDTNNLKKVQKEQLISKQEYVDLQNQYFTVVKENSELTQQNSKQLQSLITAQQNDIKYLNNSEQLQKLKNLNEKRTFYSEGKWLEGEWLIHKIDDESVIGSVLMTNRSINYSNTTYYFSNFIFDLDKRVLTFDGPAIKDGQMTSKLTPIYKVNEQFTVLEAIDRCDRVRYRKREPQL